MISRISENGLFFRCICKRIKTKYFCSSVQQYEVPIDNEFGTKPLQRVSEDLSSFTPYYPKSFNLAGYVNTSETLQKLIQLNVNLNRIEKKKPCLAEQLLKLDFEQNIKNHILFLNDYVDLEEIGDFLTKNSLILSESLDDLKVRVNYLESKKFCESQIRRIICKNPFWLMFNTTRIDRRLGFYQNSFYLNGQEVRVLASKQPKLITYNLPHVKTNMFALKEEMGFKENELKQLVLHKPKLYMISQKSLRERFNYIHNVMKIPHERILKEPEILLSRNYRVRQRHLFLERLGRAQYDPKKENYVILKALVEGTDIDFCKKYAKCNVSDYNLFLKTL